MSPKTIILSLVIFITFVAAVIGWALLFSGQKTLQSPEAFSAQDTDRPRAETTETFFDWGEMSVKDVKQQNYNLKNNGTKPLQILNVNSSCGCTAGQIIYNGKTSKEYSMHAQSGYVTEIAPGDTATVRLTYRPASMPVFGLVQREVYVRTNDPENQRLVFSIKVKVN